MTTPVEFSAWVLRASLTGFTAGCKSLLPEAPHFGDLVKVEADLTLYGLIYNLTMPDDLAVRQLILVDNLSREVVLDQQWNRLVPIEIGVLLVGYRPAGQAIRQGLPPQPPVSLERLIICDEAEVRAFTSQLDYLSLVLNTPQVPANELVTAHLGRATLAHPPEQRSSFLIGAGRHLARLLDTDLRQLDYILTRLKPK